VLVVGESMAAKTATARLFERASPRDAWQPAGPPERVMLGRSGMAWGAGFQYMASRGELKKVEGDGRTPAGAYRIGDSFGFAASSRSGYRQIAQDTVCVDDPASLAYNTVTSRKIVGKKVHGENMRMLPRYKLGLMVDYPTDAKARGGSCIFIHIQRSSTSATEGCIALPEDRVTAWQDFSESGAVLVTAPQDWLNRFADCLPSVSP
jgi:L,D-peptidoglycan transpeptidase YkuD (ErfK/YbiS/YcfS/YnhG family)